MYDLRRINLKFYFSNSALFSSYVKVGGPFALISGTCGIDKLSKLRRPLILNCALEIGRLWKSPKISGWVSFPQSNSSVASCFFASSCGTSGLSEATRMTLPVS